MTSFKRFSANYPTRSGDYDEIVSERVTLLAAPDDPFNILDCESAIFDPSHQEDAARWLIGRGCDPDRAASIVRDALTHRRRFEVSA